MSHVAKIAVLGSLNLDWTYRVPRIPAAGETISSRGVERHFGGKGANQAVAARRAGAEVEMIGLLGDDMAANDYRERLKSFGIGIGGLGTQTGFQSGSAVILVDDAGENLIVVDSAANGQVTPAMVDECADYIASAEVLLIQLECPLDAVARAAAIAREHETVIVVNPSPWDGKFAEAGIPFDHLILNETEAGHFFERTDLSRFEAPPGATVIVTRGAQPTGFSSGGGHYEEVATLQVQPVDTVGAGDSFAGAYAVAIGEGKPVLEAVEFANTAGALATTERGAQTSIPERAVILDALAKADRSTI